LIRREEHITDHIQRRREVVFLLLAGIFLGSLALLNVLGISRFIDLSHWLGISTNSPIRFSLGVGVLAYPITFLCTDFISEIYGRKRANNLVWMGLILNIWVFFMLWLGGALNPPESLGLDIRLDGGLSCRTILRCSDFPLYQKTNRKKETLA
jgi:uncharacterized PurR-regulated membrane protein YhhQ (DUF165 family)